MSPVSLGGFRVYLIDFFVVVVVFVILISRFRILFWQFAQTWVLYHSKKKKKHIISFILQKAATSFVRLKRYSCWSLPHFPRTLTSALAGELIVKISEVWGSCLSFGRRVSNELITLCSICTQKSEFLKFLVGSFNLNMNLSRNFNLEGWRNLMYPDLVATCLFYYE